MLLGLSIVFVSAIVADLFMVSLGNSRNDCRNRLSVYRIVDHICLLLNSFSTEVTFWRILIHMRHSFTWEMYLYTFCLFGQFCPYPLTHMSFSPVRYFSRHWPSARQLATAHEPAFIYISCKMCDHIHSLAFCSLWRFSSQESFRVVPERGCSSM